MMLFVCHPKILHKYCFQFLIVPFQLLRETEDNAYANPGVTSKEHYGMSWYFLEWSINNLPSGTKFLREFIFAD